jgi:PKD repeat protein
LIGIVQNDYFNTNALGVATNYSSPHFSAGNSNACATCHVPNYAVNSATNVTGHSFELDTHGCVNCHGGYTHDALLVKIQNQQQGETNRLSNLVYLLNQWALAKGPATFGAANAAKYGVNGWEYNTIGALASVTNAGPSAADQNKLPDAIKMARFNAYMVLNDGSMGVHNFNYVPLLLADAETKVMSQFTLANFKANTTAGFAPLPVTFTSMGTGVTGYNWTFGDTQTSTLANPTNTYNNPGLYAVTLTATSPTGSETVTRTNYIAVSAKPVVTFTADTRTGKTPLTVNFTNTSSNTNDVYLWRWTIDGKTIYGANTSYTFTNAYSTNITFNIALRGYTAGGNITTTSNAFITVTP